MTVGSFAQVIMKGVIMGGKGNMASVAEPGSDECHK